MNLTLRRLRGAVGMAATWATLWIFYGSAVYALLPTENGSFPPLAAFLANALRWAFSGMLGGFAFGICLATDARPDLRRLSLGRAAGWGTLSGLAVPFAFEIGGRLLMHKPIFGFHAIILSLYGLAGAGCGLLLVSLARQRARRERPLLNLEESPPAVIDSLDFPHDFEVATARPSPEWVG